MQTSGSTRAPALRAGRRERRLPETKSFILTSEFWVMVLAVAAMLFAGYVLDDLAEPTAWRYSAFIAIAYIVSRGIAKAASQRDYEPEWGAATRTTAEQDFTERRSGVYGEPAESYQQQTPRT